MPIDRLILILVLVMALAAATIAGALAVIGQIQVVPAVGLAVLGLIAVCASFAWRWFSDRPRGNASGRK